MRQIESLQLDLEIAKVESEETGEAGAPSSAQMKQVEAQLERHKEALVRLRDLSTTEKNELTTRLKEMEKACVLLPPVSCS